MKKLILFVGLAVAAVPGVGLAQDIETPENIYGRHGLPLVRSPSSGSPGVGGTPNGPKWSVSDWGSWSSSCSADAFRSRTVMCMEGESILDDSVCTEPKPLSSEIEDRFGSCDFTINGTFESGTAGWTGPSPATVEDAFSGNLAFFGRGSFTYTFAQPLPAGLYEISGWTKADAVGPYSAGVCYNGPVYFAVYSTARARIVQDSDGCTENWTQRSIRFTSRGDALYFTIDTSGRPIKIDDVVLTRIGG